MNFNKKITTLLDPLNQAKQSSELFSQGVKVDIGCLRRIDLGWLASDYF